MVFLPQICQTVFCVLYPAATLILPPVSPSTINLLTGKFLPNPTEMAISLSQPTIPAPFQFKRPFRPQFSIIKPTFAANLLNSLANKNPIINATIGQLNNNNVDIEPTPTKIYGEGTESKFPPFFEGLVQRLQSLFSVYRYPDLSRPGNALVAQPVVFTRPTLIPRPLTTTVKPISTIDTTNNNDDYNEIVGSENNNEIQDTTNINIENITSNEQDIINIGEDDEPGLELRLNYMKKTIT